MNSSVKISLIVARARNGVIGREGQLPWRLSADLAFFKKVTTGHPIIMGRTTWESLPKKPLPNRENIVLTRDWQFEAEGARVFSSLRPALEAGRALARASSVQEVFGIGGQSLYASLLPQADLLYITEVHADVEGDVMFPAFDETAFEEVTSKSVSADDKNDHDFTLRVLKRK